jgi:hypothetical protein
VLGQDADAAGVGLAAGDAAAGDVAALPLAAGLAGALVGTVSGDALALAAAADPSAEGYLPRTSITNTKVSVAVMPADEAPVEP